MDNKASEESILYHIRTILERERIQRILFNCSKVLGRFSPSNNYTLENKPSNTASDEQSVINAVEKVLGEKADGVDFFSLTGFARDECGQPDWWKSLFFGNDFLYPLLYDQFYDFIRYKINLLDKMYIGIDVEACYKKYIYNMYWSYIEPLVKDASKKAFFEELLSTVSYQIVCAIVFYLQLAASGDPAKMKSLEPLLNMMPQTSFLGIHEYEDGQRHAVVIVP